MIGDAALLAGGLVLLVAGAGWLVKGASRLAVALGVTPLVVGLTVVAFGTSAPELAVSVAAAYSGASALSVANVVGSNIFNILAILGVSALAAPLAVDRRLVRLDVPVMIGASVLLFVLAADGSIGMLDGLLLAGLIVAYTGFLVGQARRDREASGAGAAAEVAGPASARRMALPPNLALIALGVAALVLGSRFLVLGAVGLARALGVSEAVIGLTIVAAGTSLPELATSVVAALKGARDISIGNLVGSNIFNILSVLGFSGLAAGGRLVVAPDILAADLPLMIAAAAVCLPLFRAGYKVTRGEGAVLTGLYLAYIAWTVMRATSSPALGAFTGIMFDLVFPALIVGLAVMLIGAVREEEAAARKPGG
ncbi:MAG TPA: calcium/sodium antiporter [Candidatus Aminicenantes bacterium]|nr:calcium/sodium antiporter [Candidatus Aminicenantes bacterium]